jgi:hypothetical protein
VNFIVNTAKIVARILKKGLKGKLGLYVEWNSLDLETEEELGMHVGW